RWRHANPSSIPSSRMKHCLPRLKARTRVCPAAPATLHQNPFLSLECREPGQLWLNAFFPHTPTYALPENFVISVSPCEKHGEVAVPLERRWPTWKNWAGSIGIEWGRSIWHEPELPQEQAEPERVSSTSFRTTSCMRGSSRRPFPLRS